MLERAGQEISHAAEMGVAETNPASPVTGLRARDHQVQQLARGPLRDLLRGHQPQASRNDPPSSLTSKHSRAGQLNSYLDPHPDPHLHCPNLRAILRRSKLILSSWQRHPTGQDLQISSKRLSSHRLHSKTSRVRGPHVLMSGDSSGVSSSSSNSNSSSSSRGKKVKSKERALSQPLAMLMAAGHAIKLASLADVSPRLSGSSKPLLQLPLRVCLLRTVPAQRAAPLKRSAHHLACLSDLVRQ